VIHLRRLNNKGISPVIATVILVAVAIAIAIAVAFWMTGIIGLFTRFEKLEITYVYATKAADGSYWTITLKVKNTGTADATIDNIFINGRPATAWTGFSSISPTAVTSGYSLSAGSEVTITITLSSGNEFVSGQSIEVKVHTASGQEYPKLVNLP